MGSVMQLREAAAERDRRTLAAHASGPAARTLGHAAIHQARPGACRVCDTVREGRPALFTPDGQATATDMHAWMCGRNHRPGSSAARRCQVLIAGWLDVAARNHARYEMTADEALAVILRHIAS